ncbi:hypothetical protein PCASD_17318 [Puccinia coronata f. sp. avenae]|uniref:Dedicator of cytokinesis N-terminal domain-containing protein n=1 Tax=Puccinia coronata f. sp. avenae TaxID=200324 RepID=A0A2N5U2I7_9BASI|nr:hypothetical protein PCASD_17318 [Puccinia coronata f. sp. avenae]
MTCTLNQLRPSSTSSVPHKKPRWGSSHDEQFSTPLLPLKVGDKTFSGCDKPLTHEIACARCKWHTLLLIHLHQNRCQLLHLMKLQIQAQLLAQTLSIKEAVELQHNLANRLVYAAVPTVDSHLLKLPLRSQKDLQSTSPCSQVSCCQVL